MIRWLVCFVMVILLGGCVQEPQANYVINDEPNLVMVLPKMLDVNLARMDVGEPLDSIPESLIYIGKLKKEKSGPAEDSVKNKLYAEFMDSLYELEHVQRLLDKNRLNHLYIAADSSIKLGDIDQWWNHSYEIVLHFIHLNKSNRYVQSCLHFDKFDEDDLVLRMTSRNTERYSYRDSICLYEGHIYKSCDSIVNEILSRTTTVGRKNTCRRCAFKTYRIDIDSISGLVDYWNTQHRYAVNHKLDTLMFFNQGNRWKKLKYLLEKDSIQSLYVAYFNNMLLFHDDSDKLFSKNYKFANDCLRNITKSWQDFFEVSLDQIPFELLKPEVYYGDWRVANTSIIRGYSCGMEDARTPIPPPPKPYLDTQL